MGRRKLKIERLESKKARQATFSKRRGGLMKKAKELSILCDVDLALLLFSPSGKPSLFVSHNKELSTIVEQMSKLSFDEREERRAYSIGVLNRIIVNSSSQSDQGILSQNRTRPDVSKAWLLNEAELKNLKEKLAQKTKILSYWKNPETVVDLSQLKIMEDRLIASLNTIKSFKESASKGAAAAT